MNLTFNAQALTIGSMLGLSDSKEEEIKECIGHAFAQSFMSNEPITVSEEIKKFAETTESVEEVAIFGYYLGNILAHMINEGAVSHEPPVKEQQG